VKSINASGHKYGLAPLGVGWAMWRDASLLPSDLIFNVDYLGGHMPTFALNFSRPGGAIIAQYYNFIRHGHEGYRRIQDNCVDTARQLARDIDATGPFELVYDGTGGLPAVTYALKEPGRAGFSLYDLSDRLRMRGWQLASYPLPANRDETIVQRVVIRQGMNRDLIALFVEDLRRAVDHFKQHPAPITSERRVSYHH
jgi:glutamate decarboxylase